MADRDCSFFRSYLDPKEIENILKLIDDHLARRLANVGFNPSSVSTQIPDTLALDYHLYELRRSTAPLFAVTGRNPKQTLRRILNIPIRVFGHKQHHFNRELVALMEQMVAQIYSIRQIVIGVSSMSEMVQRLSTDSHLLKEQIDELRHLLGIVSEEQRRQHEKLEQIVVKQKEHSDQISIFECKSHFSDPDLYETTRHVHLSNFPEPRIVDQERYRVLLESMNGAVKINVGCGEKPLPDYINIDIRDIPGVDVVADARRLPFDDGSLAEVASFHLVEHFRKHHLKTVVLPYWRRLLARDGCLRIVCPNWEAMLERLNDGRMSLAEFSLVTFGAQDYEGDDHFAMYTPDTLTEVLQQAGFSRVEVIEHERMNGICPEMEIIAYV